MSAEPIHEDCEQCSDPDREACETGKRVLEGRLKFRLSKLDKQLGS